MSLSNEKGVVMTVSPKMFRNYQYYKYVRFDDGTILFGMVDDQHVFIARFCPQSVPVSAGKIKYCDGKYMIAEYGSFTLDFPPNKEDDKYIGDFLGQFGYTEEFVY